VRRYKLSHPCSMFHVVRATWVKFGLYDDNFKLNTYI